MKVSQAERNIKILALLQEYDKPELVFTFHRGHSSTIGQALIGRLRKEVGYSDKTTPIDIFHSAIRRAKRGNLI